MRWAGAGTWARWSPLVVALATTGAAQVDAVPKGVIFSQAQTEKEYAASPVFDLTPPFWTSSAVDVAGLERGMKNYLAGLDDSRAREIARRLDGYTRQYVGYTAGGTKWIFVNAFCGDRRHFGYWRDKIVVVMDGGICHFNLRFDVTASRFEYLQI